jgi:hypothetical protein
MWKASAPEHVDKPAAEGRFRPVGRSQRQCDRKRVEQMRRSGVQTARRFALPSHRGTVDPATCNAWAGQRAGENAEDLNPGPSRRSAPSRRILPAEPVSLAKAPPTINNAAQPAMVGAVWHMPGARSK